MKKLRWPAILMITAIIAVTGFQLYWLKNNYDREKQNLDIRTMSSFRQTILRLQSSKLGFDRFSLNFDQTRIPDTVTSSTKGNRGFDDRRNRRREPEINFVSLLQEKLKDSLWITDSAKKTGANGIKTTIRLSAGVDSVSPKPLTVKEVRIENNNKVPGQVISINDDKDSEGKNKDSFQTRNGGNVFIDDHFPGSGDGSPEQGRFQFSRNNAVFRFLYNMDSLTIKDSVTVKEITDAYAKRLKEDNMGVDFKVLKLDSANTESLNAVTIGFSKPTTFSLSLVGTMGYMLDKLKLPILFSLLLVGITIFSFALLYRNMMKQQRLAELKNEFISNITHELKTPIATVGVAIEALKSFNAIHNPERTKEYLDISQNELQRLNLLVDKVLKLSMFEKKEIDLKYEIVNIKDIVDEVVSSMKLQIEKHHATVLVNTEGDCTLQADRLHLMSVVFNLLDNALKYSNGNPVIKINLEEKENDIEMKLTDNGIGIAPEYKDKVFEKFFRVPHGDTHNAKGYGLGLSYVAHVVNKHKGTIGVESQPGEGTIFTISLPKKKS